MKQPKQKKLITPCNPKPFVVEETKESMITVSNGSQTVTRNSSNFKVVPKHFVQDSGKRKNGVEIPTTVDKTPVVQPNSGLLWDHSSPELALTRLNSDYLAQTCSISPPSKVDTNYIYLFHPIFSVISKLIPKGKSPKNMDCKRAKDGDLYGNRVFNFKKIHKTAARETKKDPN